MCRVVHSRACSQVQIQKSEPLVTRQGFSFLLTRACMQRLTNVNPQAPPGCGQNRGRVYTKGFTFVRQARFFECDFSEMNCRLRSTLKQIKDASQELGSRDLTAEQKSEIEKLENSLIQKSEPPPDVLTISTLEDELDAVLHSHGQNDLWQLSANLARKGAKPELLESLFASLDADSARAALMRISALLEITGLLNEIENSTSRISDLVGAIKEYTFMDQAPVQNVDVVKSLETTLSILNHKLKDGVEVERDYQPVPLLVDSFGSELNQVWTNVIDNAIDAMHGRGKLRVSTYRDATCVVVEIGDNGPGIPPEVQPHIFEPFFTTKGVG
jgi:signal transduction histidine kinase